MPNISYSDPYRFPFQIIRFLKEHDGTAEILEKIKIKVLEVYGEHCVGFKYEIDTHFFCENCGHIKQMLYVIIQTDANVEKAIELQEKFDREWWLNNRYKDICVTMEFVG